MSFNSAGVEVNNISQLPEKGDPGRLDVQDTLQRVLLLGYPRIPVLSSDGQELPHREIEEAHGGRRYRKRLPGCGRVAGNRLIQAGALVMSASEPLYSENHTMVSVPTICSY